MRRTSLVLAALAGFAAPALAQAPQCERYRAELASLDAGGGGRSQEYAQAAQRQRAEIQRTADYARSLGCDRQQFLFFGEAPPAACGPLNQRIGQMQANLRQLAAQAEGGNEGRRRQLLAAIDQACNVNARPRGFFEQLFGGPDQPGAPVPEMEPGTTPVIADAEPRGGSRAVCVRSCDGFFFPLSSSPGGRAGADEMCQSLCPGAETTAYYMGDQISSAVSSRGTPYSALPTALKYTKSFDSSCSCKKGDQTWSQVLANAEAMLDKRGKGDIIVTEAKAEELSRAPAAPAAKVDPRQTRVAQNAAATAKARADAAKADAANADATAAAEAAAGAAAPTASQDSAGIGPRSTGPQRVIGTQDGQRREVTLPNGEKRSVRVIGTGSAPQQ